MPKMRLKGVIPPMITPFTAEGAVDYEGFVKNIETWNNQRLAGYLVLGSNSEAIYLTKDEKLELIRLTVQVAKSGRMVIAGTGMESERETVRLTNMAAKLGADCALVLTPFFYGPQMTAEALVQFFTSVASASDIPVLLYNVPKYTRIDIPAASVETLAEHPNIVGMKDSSGNMPRMSHWKAVLPADFNVIVGTASALYPALTLGVDAAILALANCLPDSCAEVQEAFEAGDWMKARETYQRIFPVNVAVTDTFGVAGLKYACEKLGYVGGHVRSPLVALTQEQKVRVDSILAKALNS